MVPNKKESIIQIKTGVAGFKVIHVTENHKMDSYLKDYCNCNSLQASVWAIALYTTSDGEKPPFSEM